MRDFIFKEVKKVAITLFIVDALIIVITLCFGVFDSSIILGIIYGFVFANLLFILLGTVVEKALSMPPLAAKKHMKINYFARFFITAIVMIIPFVMDSINPWCVVVSLLCPKFTYTAIGFYDLISKRKEKDKIGD